METIIEHFECICTAIEPHGDHGYDPPLRDIGNEVSNWLQGLDLNIDYDIETPFTYRLQVEVHRLFPNPSDYQDFLKKYQNIKKLSATGGL